MSQVCLLIFLAAASAAAQTPDRVRADLIAEMDARSSEYVKVSRDIWEFAELGYKEVRSSAALKALLSKYGFRIEENIGGIPTAFTATWGTGKPVVGIMGEFDALPGMSQDAVPVKQELVPGGSGHGCGHNLFGAASAAASIHAKEMLERRRLPGTIRFYGTPAEEGGGGKIYMIRAGAFRDADAVFDWHPWDQNLASLSSSLANISAKFRFRGQSAHAAISPERGRSSLDAVMVFAHAVELMREHVPDATRIHYIITNGGEAPNVVPNFSEVFLVARHPQMPALSGIWERILNCARAGAPATETKLETEIVTSVYNILPNDTLGKLMQKNLEKVGGLKYTPEEQAFAEKVRQSIPDPKPPLGSQEKVLPLDQGSASSVSTDSADVSWVVPAGRFVAATWVPGVTAHTWQATACNGMSIGQKGMMVAAKTLALSALDVFFEPAIVDAAKADFERRKQGFEYRSLIPADQKPPFNYRDSQQYRDTP